MAKFALVLWLSDPKPDCWQIISVNDIVLPRDSELEEGKTYDAEWSKNEETSPAKILKLGDNKSYLKQVRINDYVKKWQEEEEKKMPAKRKAVPKVDNDFVTTTDELAPEQRTYVPDPKKQKVKRSSDGEEKASKQEKKDRKSQELTVLKEKNRKSSDIILQSLESPQTVLEARQAENVKRGLHREFGGKCPKDLHADCKETIMQLEAKIKSLEEELSSLKKGNDSANEEIIPDKPAYGKIPRRLGVKLGWKEISPGIWLDNLAITSALKSCRTKTQLARLLLDKFYSDLSGKRLHELDGDIVEAVVDIAISSNKAKESDTRGSIKQSLRKKLNQKIFSTKNPNYYKEKQRLRRLKAKEQQPLQQQQQQPALYEEDSDEEILS